MENVDTSKKRSIWVLLLVITLLATIPSLGNASQSSSLRSDVNSLNCPAFDKYSLLNEIKSNTELTFYKKTTSKEREFAKEVVSFTEEFCQIFDSVDGSENEELHAQAIDDLISILDDKEYLPKTKDNPVGGNSEDTAKTVELLIKSSLQVEGDFFALRGEEETVTSKKIDYLKKASLAYDNSGKEIDGADMIAEANAIETKYNMDMEEAENNFDIAEKNFKRGEELTDSGSFKKINAYLIIRGSKGDFQQAKSIYEYHYETALQTKVDRYLEQIDPTLNDLLKSIAILLLIIAIALFSICAFLIFRLKIWNRDRYEVSLGNELKV